MTSSAQARTWLATIENLVDRFAVIFPRWPSLGPARDAIRMAARQLDQLDSGGNPFSPDNPDPAGTAINRPYSFLHYMASTATATDPNQLLDPLTGKALIISAPQRADGSAAGIAETLAYYADQIARVERAISSGRPSPVQAAPTPTPTPAPAPTPAPSSTAATAVQAAQAPSYQPASSPAAVTSLQPSTSSWASTALNAARSAFTSSPTPTPANSLAAPSSAGQVASSARATGGNWLPIAIVGLVGLLAFSGKKGARR